jgi:hypothetical protein
MLGCDIGLGECDVSDQTKGPIDREMQRAILAELRDEYPGHLHFLPLDGQYPPGAIRANLLYLEEHGLCDSGLRLDATGYSYVGGARITARGLDFLANDGGLSAILGVVTVKLHADTIRDLIAAKIEATPLPESEKSALRKYLAALPEVALRAAATDLMKSGLDHLPNVILWVRAFTGI